MPLTVTRRGRIYHAQGTVHVGTIKVRIRQSTGRDDRSEALQVAHQIEQDVVNLHLRGGKADPNHTPFYVLVDNYNHKPDPIHPNDRNRNRQLLKYFKMMPVEDIKTKSWNEYLKAKRPKKAPLGEMAPATINRHRANLHAILRYSSDIGYRIPKIPEAKGKVGKSGKAEDRIRYLSVTDQDKLIAAYGARVRPIAIMLCFQGCRVSEALRLQWPDLDLDRALVTFTEIRGGNRRTVPLHPRIHQSLARLHNHRHPKHEYVYMRPGGEPYTEREDGGAGIKTAHTNALKRAGISNFRIHDWRHHWASHMVMSGAPLRAVQELGGWSSLKMVQRYSQLSPEHLRSSINLLQPKEP
tara:strand:+ start:930 stop:1991 length:1062 start_codon:yes stop_codon:yes gene_type:complete